MDVYDQAIYIELEEAIAKAKANKSNLAIVTFSGSGISYLLKAFIKKNGLDASFDLIDFDSEDRWLEGVKKRVSDLGIEEKIGVVICGGKSFREWEKSEISSHFYTSLWVGCRSEADNKKLALEINPKLNDKEIEEIFKLSAGAGKLTKYLAINFENFNKEEVTYKKIIEEIKQSRQGFKKDEIERLGLSMIDMGLSEGIEIDFDLSIREDGQMSKEKLTEVEARILREMMQNEGKMTKDKVSEIKWGKAEFDEFSDQAINKTMRRINEKMNVYKITTIPKVGFVIEKR